jgi:Subtilase family
MFRSFNRKLFTFLVTATLVAFASVYLHSCQSSSEPSAKAPQPSPSVASSQPSSTPSPVSSSSPDDCDESNEPDCQKEPPTLDWLLGAYATLGNSYQGFIIDFRGNAPDVKTLSQANNLQVSDVSPDEKTYLLQGGVEELSKLKDSDLAGYIGYIEPNYIYEQASGTSVNDPYYPEQWNLKEINIEEAWKITQGEGITVAILDTGVTSVKDFDSTTFTQGYDFVSNPEKLIEFPSSDPESSSGNNPHGTNLAGIIAQATNNSFGFAGIAPKAKIMPIRVLDKEGRGDAVRIARGIEWAVNHGADVVNCSFTIINEGASNYRIGEAIQYAKSKGVVVVAAAGNEGKQQVLYPASDQNAIAVAAYTPNLTRASYSNYGSKITIFAPGGQGIPNTSTNKSGVDSQAQAVCQEIGIATNNPLMNLGITQSWIIKEIRRGNEKESHPKGQVCSGTSQATAGVSGVVALIKAAGIKDPDIIKKILLTSADKGCYDLSISEVGKKQELTEKNLSANSLDLDSQLKRLEDKREGKPEPEPSDSFDPGKIGRLDAGTAVKLATDFANPAMRDNIALARHLTKIGAELYESCACYVPQNTKKRFGLAAFSEIKFTQIKHSEGKFGWKVRGELITSVSKEASVNISSLEPSLEALADVSGYIGRRNFVVPEKYRQDEENYKQSRAKLKRSRSQSTPN